MRRPWAVRSFCVRYMTDTVAAGRRKSALTSAELYGGFTNSPLYKNRAPRVFSVNLRNILLGQSRTIPATCVSRRRLLVYSTGRRLRNSKNVADVILNRGLRLICRRTMSAPRMFSVNLRNILLGQSRAIPATWRFPPSATCLLHRSPFAQ